MNFATRRDVVQVSHIVSNMTGDGAYKFLIIVHFCCGAMTRARRREASHPVRITRKLHAISNTYERI
jgi:hypothetical protein